MTMGKYEGHFVCPECNEKGGHYAKGLCVRCYNKFNARRPKDKERSSKYHKGWINDNRERYNLYMRKYIKAKYREKKEKEGLCVRQYNKRKEK
jgi:hypothetical protein